VSRIAAVLTPNCFYDSIFLTFLLSSLILRVNMGASADVAKLGRAEEEHVRLLEKAELWHKGLSVALRLFWRLVLPFDP